MQIVLLGTGGPLPDPQRGGSAILIHAAGRYHLFDCGVGATRQMVRAQVDPATVNHVFFSHLHYDHTADFPYFILSGWIGNRQARPQVYGPPGTKQFVEHLFEAGAFAADIQARSQYPIRQRNRFAIEPAVTEIAPGVVFDDGQARVTAAFVEHIPREISQCFALRLDAEGKSLVFSGDTAPCDAVVELARGANLLIHECTFPEWAIEHRKTAGIGTWSHTGPTQLGALASRAGVRRLVATHFAPWETTNPVLKRHLAPHAPIERVGPQVMDEVVRDIRKQYDGELLIARDLMRIDL